MPATHWILKNAFIDIRLRPGISPPPAPYGPLQSNATPSIKPEVHHVSQRRHRRTEPRPQGIRIQKFVKIGPAVPEICSLTDRHTDRRVDHNTPHPYRDGATISGNSVVVQLYRTNAIYRHLLTTPFINLANCM